MDYKKIMEAYNKQQGRNTLDSETQACFGPSIKDIQSFLSFFFLKLFVFFFILILKPKKKPGMMKDNKIYNKK